MKFLPLFLLVIPGMAARVLYRSALTPSNLSRNEVGCSEPARCQEICESKAGCTNIAFILLVLDLMPTGVFA